MSGWALIFDGSLASYTLGRPVLRRQVIVFLVCLSVCAAAVASVVVTSEQEVAGVPAASATDLLQTQFDSVINGGLDERGGTQPETRLRDGDGTDGVGDSVHGPRTSDGDTVTYVLDIATNLRGYTISTIDIFPGHWGDARNQMSDFDIHYATVDDTNDFSNAIIEGGSSGDFPADPYEGRVRVDDDGGADLAVGVAAVRITFNTVENGWTTLYEIDVHGTVTQAQGTVMVIR